MEVGIDYTRVLFGLACQCRCARAHTHSLSLSLSMRHRRLVGPCGENRTVGVVAVPVPGWSQLMKTLIGSRRRLEMGGIRYRAPMLVSLMGSRRRWCKVLKRPLPRSRVQIQVHRITPSVQGRPSVRPIVTTAPFRVVAEPNSEARPRAGRQVPYRKSALVLQGPQAAPCANACVSAHCFHTGAPFIASGCIFGALAHCLPTPDIDSAQMHL